MLVASIAAGCGSDDSTEQQIRDAIDAYVAAVNAGELAESDLSNCTNPIYATIAAQHPGLRPFRIEIESIDTAVGDHLAARGAMTITPDREGQAAVVRGAAYLGDRPVPELTPDHTAPYPAEDGWIWTKAKEDGLWHAIECK